MSSLGRQLSLLQLSRGLLFLATLGSSLGTLLADEIRGPVFTVIMSVNDAVYGLGFIVAGPLTDAVGPRWIFGGVAVVLALRRGWPAR